MSAKAYRRGSAVIRREIDAQLTETKPGPLGQMARPSTNCAMT